MSISASDELRKLILQQAERHNIPLIHLCSRVGVDYREFLKKYVNIKNISKDGVRLLSDRKITEIAALVGINIRTILVIKENYAEEAMKLKQTLKDEYIDNKKKRPPSETT